MTAGHSFWAPRTGEEAPRVTRGDVRISNLRRGALAHLRGGSMPGPGADSSLGQDASPNHGPGPPCLNCLRAPSGGSCGLTLRFLKSRQILRAQESREDYDCRPPPITPSSCPGPRRIPSQSALEDPVATAPAGSLCLGRQESGIGGFMLRQRTPTSSVTEVSAYRSQDTSLWPSVTLILSI
ncbi:unnamed protein product [Rangifer tarandus platyrhynchus]|uniref:Uncharacterized protein n=2 Tax=Rangifer tarandus platyrhynchus TaxID=3082113 RepID=A0ACB0EVR7_RANTA|nr:unnamed protein product [Rangifer tarandus platyrhynchus]CAI9704544.1 unnamed protein product [Rangifer tarandus platyrhynchus]